MGGSERENISDLESVKRYAVLGSPILHSHSPRMFNYLFAKEGINAHYSRLLADDAKEAMRTFHLLRLNGMNVTSPFKEEIVPHLTKTCGDASILEAVNTVVFKERESTEHKKKREYWGYNTDPEGVLKTFQHHGVHLENLHVLIIGMGGAGKAGALALYREGAQVTLSNRSFGKAKSFAQRLNALHVKGDKDLLPVKAVHLSEIKEEIPKAQCIFIALPQGVIPFDLNLLNKKHLLFDANYTKSEICKKAHEIGAKVFNPLHWLIYQGIAGYRLFLDRESVPSDLFHESLKVSLEKTKEPLVLVGFMGSGKTAIGKGVGKKTHRTFIDTDRIMEKKSGKSIAELFQERGEGEFRHEEQEALIEALNQQDSLIATGGGVLIDERNRKALRNRGLTIYLYTPFEEIIRRLDEDGGRGKRPLYDDKIFQRYWSRFNDYFCASQLIINTEKGGVRKLRELLSAEINHYFTD